MLRCKKKVKKKVSRKSLSVKYAGLPCDLHTREPCTLREMIQCYYHVKEHNPKMNFYEIC